MYYFHFLGYIQIYWLDRTTYFYKTWDIYEFHNLGIRLCFLSFALRIVVAHLASSNSSHCQLRNEISNMKVYLFNEFFYLIILTVQKCPLEDNDHFVFICSKYNNLRLVLLDSIQDTLIPRL
jgi:hypothetical protein